VDGFLDGLAGLHSINCSCGAGGLRPHLMCYLFPCATDCETSERHKSGRTDRLTVGQTHQHSTRLKLFRKNSDTAGRMARVIHCQHSRNYSPS